MTRLTVTAAELQAGDRIMPAPGSPAGTIGTLIKGAKPKIAVTYDAWTAHYDPGAVFQIERPEPTVTIEIPRSAAEFMADISWGSSKVQEFTKACHKALYPAPEAPEKPVLRVGAKVRRTGYEDEGLGRYGIGTVTFVSTHGSYATVIGPNGKKSNWSSASFEVVG